MTNARLQSALAAERVRRAEAARDAGLTRDPCVQCGQPARHTVRAVRMCGGCLEEAGRAAAAKARAMNAELPADVRGTLNLKGMIE